MLDSQWFAVAANEGQSLVRDDAFPKKSKSVHIDTAAAGRLRVVYGATVLVEEDEQTLALAVGDTRSLRNLAEFRSSGPMRHAVICVIDKIHGSVRIITDRIGYSKIFCRDFGGDGFALATHATLLDRQKLKISINALASALANGTQFNNSSLYSDVRILQRASVHEFVGGKHNTVEYWHYGFEEAVTPGTAKQRLKDAVVDAVCDQVCDSPILLSLSGGFDSSGILGILTKYAKPQVLNTFSYVFGEPKPGSDAAVSRSMASLAKVPHENVQAYCGNIQSTIPRNAQLGQGMANFCDEVDAWFQQGKAHAGSVLLAGDECFGWSGRRFVTVEDAFRTVCLRRFDAAAILLPYLDSSMAKSLSDGLDADVDQVMRSASQSNLHDLKDYWYLDQRISFAQPPWRRFLVGEFFEVREPFLQTQLLEVIKTLPTAERIGKVLYREVIQELAPEVFSIPRARTGQEAPNWRSELIKGRSKIDELLQIPSALDELIDPSVIRALLNSLETETQNKPSWKRRISRLMGPSISRFLARFVRPEMHLTAPEIMLLRLLSLREFLINTPSAW